MPGTDATRISAGAVIGAIWMRQIGGISQKMLTQTLRELEQRRLLTRRVRTAVPPHVEYELTSLGQSLAKAISTLDDWVIRNYQRTIGS